MTTKRQKKAIDFIEYMLDIKFEGDINNFDDVSDFISDYLDDAKMIADEAIESYYGNFDY